MEKRGLIGLFFAVVILFLVGGVFAIPQTFSVHGKLSNSSGVLEGTYEMNFSIYEDYSGGSALWTSLRNVTTDSDGVYDVVLGGVDLNFSEQYYLGVKVESDDEMTPRINLSSSPYAFRAENVSVAGVEFTSNVDFGAYNVTVGTNALFVDASSGRVGIGTVSPAVTLDVNGSLRVGERELLDGISQIQMIPDTSFQTHLYTYSDGRFAIYKNGGTGVGAALSVLHNGNVGIGTITPQTKLEVNGSLNISGSGASLIFPDGTSMTTAGTGDAGTLDGLDSTFFMPLNTSVVGDFDFNGGWESGGFSIEGGDIYAQTGWFYNISSLEVTHLEVNGSLFPDVDDQFDVGNGTFRWRDLYLSGEVLSDGTGDSYFMGNVGIGTASPSELLVVGNDLGNVGTGNSIALGDDSGNVVNLGIGYNSTNRGSIYWEDGDDGHLSFGTITTTGGQNWGAMNLKDGRFGIGTTSPSTKLEVNGSVNISGSGAGLTFPDGTSMTTASTAGLWTNSSGNATYVDGNVGIGTTSPVVDLHIGEDNTNARFYLAGPASGSSPLTTGRPTNDNAQLMIGRTGTSDGGGVEFQVSPTGSGYGWKINAPDADSRQDLRIFNRHNNAVWSEKMTIQGSTGNVGIGTTGPGTLLHLEAASNPTLRISEEDGATRRLLQLGVDTTNNETFITSSFYSGGAWPLTFIMGTAEIMRIDNTGNVGIGTTSPSEELDVNGSINIADGDAYMYDGEQALRLAEGTDSHYANTFVGVDAGNATATKQTATGYQAGYQNTGTEQTVTGYQAGYQNTGPQQTAIGYQAGYENTGGYTVALGRFAGYQNTGGEQTAVGFYAGRYNTGTGGQTAIGYWAGYNNTGSYSTALGNNAGYQNKGLHQVALGNWAGRENTGSSQTATGYYAGYQNTGVRSTVVGYYAGYQNSGDYQTAMGYYAGYLNTELYQTAIGHQAGYNNTGSRQTILGNNAGYQNEGDYQTATGNSAGSSNTGIYQVAMGYYAGYQNTATSQTAMGYYAGYQNTGTYQTAIGTQAGRSNDQVSQTAIGYQAGYQNTGDYQTATGAYAGYQNTGTEQTAVGYYAGRENIGTQQTVIGYRAGYLNTGTQQTAVGRNAGYNNTGGYQAALGMSAGYQNEGITQTVAGFSAGTRNTGSNQVGVGYNAGYDNSGDRAIGIGREATKDNSGDDAVGVGYQAGEFNIGNSLTAVGSYAGYNNTGGANVFMGHYAGYENTGAESTAIGHQAGGNNVGYYITTIGHRAGMDNTGDYQTTAGHSAGYLNTGNYQTAVGYYAGYNNTGASGQTAIGYNAGHLNTGTHQVAVGYFAGESNTGVRVIGIGSEAARDNTGDNVIAIGFEAAESNTLHNVFILKQSSVNAVPLIQGNFSTGDIEIAGYLQGASCQYAKEATFNTERGTIVANQGLAMGNGQAPTGAPQVCAGTVTTLAAMCSGAADASNHVAFELRIDGVAQTCDTAEVTSLDTMYQASSCGVSFSSGDILNCYSKTLTGAVTTCVCTFWVQYD
ncbi:hypothetical protein K8R30_02255 [archaeon]|nr:hypothetical protein [archaeon]